MKKTKKIKYKCENCKKKMEFSDVGWKRICDKCGTGQFLIKEKDKDKNKKTWLDRKIIKED